MITREGDTGLRRKVGVQRATALWRGWGRSPHSENSSPSLFFKVTVAIEIFEHLSSYVSSPRMNGLHRKHLLLYRYMSYSREDLHIPMEAFDPNRSL